KKYGALGGAEDVKGDELGQLSLTLSSMTSQIESIITELKDRNARVDTIINSMGSGLIAVDRFMRIITINPVAGELFGVSGNTPHIGVPLVQIIRNRLLNDLLWKSILNNQVFHEEVQIYQSGKRILAIHISPIYPMDGRSPNSGALAYINDITQIRKLEEMRSEFVSNVTHELKTPLTSIRGFVETLKNGAMRDENVADKFLDIIDLEADRLSSLINDILELSEIEGMKREHEPDTFKLQPLVQEVESILVNTAKDKGVHFELNVGEDVTITANRNRMKQLLINLMDNAVKYNKRDGTIWVWTENQKNRVEIHVKDTGIGIPEDKQTRIFERFYRVDKGRSREMGGTGLGLSIVKHIANLYNGSIKVLSEEGKGSEFIVSLPLNGEDPKPSQ
ncbi:MAG: ATP-binding protein, partial [Clostridia bacterium]|nr:ATP-binding protein [Clostridia bacterium]